MTLGQRVAGLIGAKRVTAKAVADAARVNPSLITRCCSLDRDVDVRRRTLESLAAALEVSTDYLVGRRPDLDALPFDRVAARESFLVFQQKKNLGQRESDRYAGLLDAPEAPRTSEEWLRFDTLRREFASHGQREHEQNLIGEPRRFSRQAIS